MLNLLKSRRPSKRPPAPALKPPDRLVEVRFSEDDLLVITSKAILSNAQAEWIQKSFEDLRANQRNVVVLGGGMEITVVKDFKRRRAEAEK